MFDSILPLAARNLRYEVNGTVLIDDLSMTVAPGSFTVVLGPNGGGQEPAAPIAPRADRPDIG